MNEHEKLTLTNVAKKIDRVIKQGNLPRYLNQELAESLSMIRNLIGEDATSLRLLKLVDIIENEL